MPRPIMKLADSLLHNPVRVTVAPAPAETPLINQSVHMIGRAHKQALLEYLLTEHDIRRALVFTRTKHGADKVARKLARAGIAADAIHGNKSQPQRERALNAFRSGRARVLVATDVAARGIDVDAISHVFNFDLPNEPESYVHRIGRTGRAGATGAAIAFCDHEERPHLRAIEKLTGAPIPILDNPDSLPNPRSAPAPAHAQRHRPRTSNTGHHANAPKRRAPRATDDHARSARPHKRTRKSDVPAHPSGPTRARTTARTGAAAEPPASKPSYSRGPHSQRTRRPRRK